MIFLQDLDFHVVKGDLLDKSVFGEAAFVVKLEIFDDIVKPDGLGKVQLVAGLFDGIHYFVGSGV